MKSCLDAAEELLQYLQGVKECDGDDVVAKLISGTVSKLDEETFTLYLLATSDSSPALTPTQLVELDRRDYVVNDGIVFHPGHWRVSTEIELSQGYADDGKGVFIRNDSALTALTSFADNWGRSQHLW